MPRRRRIATTPRARGRGGRGQLQFRNNQSPVVAGPHQHTDFTLADEARRTLQNDHSSWENANLRRMRIEFVSAGFAHKREKSDDSPVDNTAISARSGQQRISHPADDGVKADDQEDSETNSSNPDLAENKIAIKTEGDINQYPSLVVHGQDREYTSRGVTPKLERRPSQDSSSSGEELLFQGRNRTLKQVRRREMSLSTIHAELRAVEDQLPNSSTTLCQPTFNTVEGFWGLGGNHCRHKHQVGRDDATTREDDAVFADYIANLRQNGEIMFSYDIVQLDDDDDDDRFQSSDHTAAEASQTAGSPRNDGSEGVHESNDGFDNNAPSKTTPDNISQEDHRDMSETGMEIQSEQDEVHNQFDFMDWEQPSLRKRNTKWSQLSMYFQDGDSELEQKFQAAWKKDRLKKSERRKMREELRVSGIPDQRIGCVDLRVKYPTGMSMQQVAEELKAFLLRNDESLLLPPMDTHARKMIHELANKFNLKSKSIGKGEQRRPSLHRKKGTLRFDQITFNNAFTRIHRKFFPRVDVQNKSRQIVPNRSSHSAVKIRDGEIVGGAAPELSAENRGRTMLEKMGWSSGTALGAEDNKGILQPVTHTMKRSKAGLG